MSGWNLSEPVFGGHIVRRLGLAHLRHMLYAVTPAETSFATVADVPDYYVESSSWYVLLILAEMVLMELDRARKGRRRGDSGWSHADNITSVNAGMFSLLSRQLRPMVFVSTFSYVHEHYRLFDLPWDSPYTWLIGFVGCDLTYYLWHRASHEVGILWSFHQVHHSSEYYNLSTALRQSYIQDLATLLFDPLLALLAPPQVILTHKALTLINQYWIHTELIPHLGPLEYVLNTPSSHRVHHGRNAYCIDKNYAGTFIIWDRLFGTYAAERRTERIAYGLVTPLNTFDQLYLQHFETKYFLWDKPAMMTNWLDKLKAVVYPPGWFPDPKTGAEPTLSRFLWWYGMADCAAGISASEAGESKPYNPRYAIWALAVAWWTHVFALVVYIATAPMFADSSASGVLFWSHLFYQLAGFQTQGALLNNSGWFASAELCRNLAALAFGWHFWWPHAVTRGRLLFAIGSVVSVIACACVKCARLEGKACIVCDDKVRGR